MNKRIARLLRTNITIFSLCLVLFALAAIPFDVRLAIGEGVAAVAFFLLGRRRSKATQQKSAPVYPAILRRHGLRPLQQYALHPPAHDGL